jgi:hypothetical protein
MADSPSGKGPRLTASSVINAALITVGYPETLDTDLDFSADVLSRAVKRLRQHETRLQLREQAVKDKLKSIYVLHVMYCLEKKAREAKKQ